jgi:hypothetical protein
MVPLLFALLMMAPPNSGSIGENRAILRDPQQGAMPVTDKYLIPARVPDCVDAYQVQRAREERIKGFEPECMLPLKSDRNRQPH